jgi:hypothetical protein
MSEKSLRAKAIPGLRLRVRAVRPCGDHWGRPGVGKRARLTRNEAAGCTMPTAWELKMEILADRASGVCAQAQLAITASQYSQPRWG